MHFWKWEPGIFCRASGSSSSSLAAEQAIAVLHATEIQGMEENGQSKQFVHQRHLQFLKINTNRQQCCVTPIPWLQHQDPSLDKSSDW